MDAPPRCDLNLTSGSLGHHHWGCLLLENLNRSDPSRLHPLSLWSLWYQVHHQPPCLSWTSTPCSVPYFRVITDSQLQAALQEFPANIPTISVLKKLHGSVLRRTSDWAASWTQTLETDAVRHSPDTCPHSYTDTVGPPVNVRDINMEWRGH